jgi:hypothetical protein
MFPIHKHQPEACSASQSKPRIQRENNYFGMFAGGVVGVTGAVVTLAGFEYGA